MRLILAVAAALLAFVPPPTAAQGPTPSLVLDDPTIDAPLGIPLAPASAPMAVPWTYGFGDPASAAAVMANGDVTIAWALDCGESGLQFVGETVTRVPYVPGQAEYSGTATLAISASADSLGDLALPCTLKAEAPGAADATSAAAEIIFEPLIAFVGLLEVKAPSPQRQAGPQKQIPFPIEVTNRGNARTVVTFDLVERPQGRWDLLLPEQTVLDMGETVTVMVVVATPYENGPNDGAADIRVLVTPTSMLNPEGKGTPVEVPLHAAVKGLYIPGPSMPLLLAGLAVAAAFARVRR